jgi:methionyl-tRNA formyltransferase
VTRDRLIFFGTDAFSVPALIRLLAEGWNVCAIVTKPDSRTGRGHELTMPAVKRLALAKSIPLFQPTRLLDIRPELAALKPDAGIVVAYGKIIPARVLGDFPKGLINIHPSLLPKYRGPSPIESAIISGDADTGITLMKLDTGMDTGPTYDQTKLQLTGIENRLDLYERLAELGAEFLATKLDRILDGNIVAIPQDNLHATVTKMLTKADGQIDWQKTAESLEREVRAYLGWPGSSAIIADTLVTITAARTLAQNGPAASAFKTAATELAVYAGTGALIIDKLKPAGKREMTGAEFLAGHPL